jgi:hypothetical protein
LDGPAAGGRESPSDCWASPAPDTRKAKPSPADSVKSAKGYRQAARSAPLHQKALGKPTVHPPWVELVLDGKVVTGPTPSVEIRTPPTAPPPVTQNNAGAAPLDAGFQIAPVEHRA